MSSGRQVSSNNIFKNENNTVQAEQRIVYPVAFLSHSGGQLANEKQGGVDTYTPWGERQVRLINAGERLASMGSKAFHVMSIKGYTGRQISRQRSDTGERVDVPEAWRLNCQTFEKAKESPAAWWSWVLVQYDTPSNCLNAKQRLLEHDNTLAIATMDEIYDFAASLDGKPAEFEFHGTKVRINTPNDVTKVIDEMRQVRVGKGKTLPGQEAKQRPKYNLEACLAIYQSSTGPNEPSGLWTNTAGRDSSRITRATRREVVAGNGEIS